MYYVVWGVRKNSSRQLFPVGFDNMLVISFFLLGKQGLMSNLIFLIKKLKGFFENWLALRYNLSNCQRSLLVMTFSVFMCVSLVWGNSWCRSKMPKFVRFWLLLSLLFTQTILNNSAHFLWAIVKTGRASLRIWCILKWNIPYYRNITKHVNNANKIYA